jgi:SepF-like predicted cell division protein (DUF552 family)
MTMPRPIYAKTLKKIIVVLRKEPKTIFSTGISIGKRKLIISPTGLKILNNL